VRVIATDGAAGIVNIWHGYDARVSPE